MQQSIVFKTIDRTDFTLSTLYKYWRSAHLHRPLRPRHTAQNFDFLKNISALKKIPLPKFDPVFWHMLVMSTRGRLIQISKTFSVYDHHNFKFQFKCVPFVLVYWDFWFLPRQPEFDSPHGSDTIILDYSISCRLRQLCLESSRWLSIMTPQLMGICPYFKERSCESGFWTKSRRDVFLHCHAYYCSALWLSV